MNHPRAFSWPFLMLIGIAATAGAQVDGDPFTGPEVEVCGPEVPMDAVGVGNPAIDGHTLTVMIGYACGCAEHFFGGCWSGDFAESDPVQTDLAIAHDANGEGCEVACFGGLSLDLLPIAEAYHLLYGPGPGTVVIQIAGVPEPVAYSFPGVVPVEPATWASVKAGYR